MWNDVIGSSFQYRLLIRSLGIVFFYSIALQLGLLNPMQAEELIASKEAQGAPATVASSLEEPWQPLYQSCTEKPLLYLRASWPWKSLLPQPLDLRAWKQAWLNRACPDSSLGQAVKNFLVEVDSPLELALLPPANRFLPIPSMVMRFETVGKAHSMAVESLVVNVLSQIQGSPATWLKFKVVEPRRKGSTLKEVFLPGGRLWIECEGTLCSVYYSSRLDFMDSFKGGVPHLDDGLKEDASFFVRPRAAFSYYDGWLKRVAKPFHQAYVGSDAYHVDELSASSKGRDSEAQVALKLKVLDHEGLSVFKSWQTRPQSMDLGEGDFRGALSFPDAKVLRQLPWLNSGSLGALLKPWWDVIENGSQLGFSWSENQLAPDVRLRLKQSDLFEKSLKSLLGSGVHWSTSGVLKQVSWGRQSLNYITKGKDVYFSPLPQALLDVRASELSSAARTSVLNSDEVLWVKYPLSGRSSGQHYTLMKLLLHASEAWGLALDPRDYPAFSSMAQPDQVWQGEGVLKIKVQKNEWRLDWHQPYGFLGLAGGIKLQSSSWLYFLSLLQLTKNSF